MKKIGFNKNHINLSPPCHLLCLPHSLIFQRLFSLLTLFIFMFWSQTLSTKLFTSLAYQILFSALNFFKKLDTIELFQN